MARDRRSDESNGENLYIYKFFKTKNNYPFQISDYNVGSRFLVDGNYSQVGCPRSANAKGM
jgi:hypothetical protein